jgi:hypothetical protein
MANLQKSQQPTYPQTQVSPAQPKAQQPEQTPQQIPPSPQNINPSKPIQQNNPAGNQPITNQQ